MASLKIAVSQLLLCTLLGVTGINGKPPNAVVGGSLAGEKEFPYAVGLTVFGRHICGGTILDATHIVTAAHCVDNKNVDLVKNMVVVSGTNNIRRGNQHRLKSIKKHPLYSESNSWKNDIAIITLSSAIKFGDREKAVKLPTKDTPVDVLATATGWGDLSYPKGTIPVELHKLDMKVISNQKCLPSIGVHDSQLCAFAKSGSGLCTGDSGGPLVSDGVLVGIISWVIPCGVGHPDVFTRVYDYLKWIKEEVKN